MKSDSEIDSPDDPPPLPAADFLSHPSEATILSLIHHALREQIDSDDLVPTVQKVKGLLYERKWLEVFGDPGLLGSYAARWVPGRALCFREMLGGLSEVREMFTVLRNEEDEEGEEDGETQGEGEEDRDEKEKRADGAVNDEGVRDSFDGDVNTSGQLPHHILSLGGGAASELIAIASLVSSVLHTDPSSSSSWKWTGLDIGSWNPIISLFRSSFDTEWSITPSNLEIISHQLDLLAPSSLPLIAEILTSHPPKIVTLLFTLTELLSQSVPSTFGLLKDVTQHLPSGTLFVVADSASDIGEFAMGKSGRKWPAYMILDMVLLGSGQGDEGEGEWEVVRRDDSRWYRLPEGIGEGWPVKLENTRYWLRVYRRR